MAFNKLNDKTYRLRLRRGEEDDLEDYTIEGEPVYLTDTKALFIGDDSDQYIPVASKCKTTRVATTYTATEEDHVVYCDTDGGAFTITLPAAPLNGATLRIINCGSSGNNLTVGRNSKTIRGAAADSILTDGQILELTYETTEQWW